MNVARYHAAATVFNGCICIAGGTNNSVTKLKSVELFDPGKGEWRKLPDMNKARTDFSLFGANGFLYAMGSSGIVEKYDPWTNRWTVVNKLDFEKYVSRDKKKGTSDLMNFTIDFQIEPFTWSQSIVNVIEFEGDFYAMTKTGRIGLMQSGLRSLLPTVSFTYEYGSTIGGMQILFQN